MEVKKCSIWRDPANKSMSVDPSIERISPHLLEELNPGKESNDDQILFKRIENFN